MPEYMGYRVHERAGDDRRKVLLAIAMGVAAVFGYGASALLTKVGVASADGITVGMLRSLIALPVALALIVLYRLPLPWRGQRKWLLLTSGLCGLVAFPVLFSWGLEFTTAGHAASASVCGAVMAGVIMAVVERRWPPLLWWGGIAIGVSGALLLIWEAIGLGIEGVSWQGDALVFSGMFVGVFAYIASGRLTREVGPLAVTMWSIVVASAVLAPALALHSSTAALAAITPASWGGIVGLAWGVTIGVYVLWNRALADGGIARIGALQLLQPVFGVLLAVALLDEPLTPLLVAATLIAILGVALVQRAR